VYICTRSSRPQATHTRGSRADPGRSLLIPHRRTLQGLLDQYYGGVVPLGPVVSRRVLAVRRACAPIGVRWGRSGDVGWDAFPPFGFSPAPPLFPNRSGRRWNANGAGWLRQLGNRRFPGGSGP
jgi:hypothetical protein